MLLLIQKYIKIRFTLRLPAQSMHQSEKIKPHVIRYCENVFGRSGENLFWFIKPSGEVYLKPKVTCHFLLMNNFVSTSIWL